MNHAARDFATGLQGFWRGVHWLTARPKTMIWLMVPWLIALLAFASGIWLFWSMGSEWLTQLLMSWMTAWTDHWAWEMFYVIVKALMWFSVLLLCLVSAMAIGGVVASPVYEWISLKIEREILGDQHQPVPWSRMARVLLGEMLKAIVVTLVPFVMVLIPGVNLFAGVVAAFLLGWDFYDYPLARRGWTFQQRWQFVRSEFWTVLGFGVWLAIPVVQIVFVPLAVAGGTILNVEALQRRGLAAAKLNQGGLS